MPPLGGSFDIDTFCKAGLLSAAFTPCIPAVVTVPASSLLKLRLSMALLLSLSHHMNAKRAASFGEAALYGTRFYWIVTINVVEPVMLALVLSAAVTVTV
jgi:hypothetical protein